MTDADWLACSEPTAMLSFLRDRGFGSERKLRLFGVACCRLIWPLFTDDRCRAAVEVVERYADGAATAREMGEAWRGVNVARDLAFGTRSTAPRKHRSWLGRATSWAAYALASVPPADGDRPEVVMRDVAEAAESARDVRGQVRRLRAAQAGLLRDIFGNPFRPVAVDPAWRTSTAVALAKHMYESRDFSPMPILADALHDAGCDSEDILTHCRGPGQHAGGCWVVDMVLGKG